jgi:hypothetical protein
LAIDLIPPRSDHGQHNDVPDHVRSTQPQPYDGAGSFSEMTANDPDIRWGGQWARKHYKQMIVVRVLLAPWILFVTVFLCVKGYWWGLVFLPFLVLDLWLLRNLVRYARTQGR